MDVHIGDLHPAIVGESACLSVHSRAHKSTDREIEIVQSLQEKILVYDDIIGHACDVCAELDCLLSFAVAARSHGYQRPHMTEENVIDIKQGRCAISQHSAAKGSSPKLCFTTDIPSKNLLSTRSCRTMRTSSAVLASAWF